MLSGHGALKISGPKQVLVSVGLLLAITAIEHSGSVAKEAVRRVEELLDPGAGGLDRTGWRLGEMPSKADIAAKLDGIKHLETIDDVSIQVVGKDGALTQRQTALGPTQLTRLAPDGVTVEFQPVASAVFA
jgi:hypothetical protein